MAPPQWAYQVENFEPPPDEELICSICRAIFCEPVQCPCNHVFCRVCITKWLQTNRSCPVCRKRATRYCIQEVVPLIKNMIMKLNLHCRNSEHGCNAKFSLEGCEIHMRECVYELVLCKNKPCKLQLFRKDIRNHELNDCPHRYTKCESCGLRISPISTEKHNCILELKKALQKKEALLKQKRLKIKELRKKIKSFKDNSQYSSDATSSVGSFSALITLPDSPNDTTSTSESSENSFSDAADDSLNRIEDTAENASGVRENTNENQELSEFDRYLALFNPNSQSGVVSPLGVYLDEQDSIEYPRSSTPTHGMNSSIEAVPEVTLDDSSQARRPAKRRHPPVLLNTSDDDNGESEDLPSLPSPKRCWRFATNEVGEPSTHAVSESSSASSGQMNGTYFGPGPSFPSTSTESSVSNNDNSNSSRPQFNFKPRFRKRQPKAPATRKSPLHAPSLPSTWPSNGSAVFERTMALLEQYNLESDSEWLPEYSSHRGNDTTSDSDTSIDRGQITSSDESSISDLESNDSSEGIRRSSESNLGDILYRFYDTSDDDDDPEWQPSDRF